MNTFSYKPYCIFSIIILFASAVFPQTKISYHIQKKLKNIASHKSIQEMHVFVKGNLNLIRQETELAGGIFKYGSGDIASIRISNAGLADISQKNFFKRIENNPYSFEPLNDQMIINNNVFLSHFGYQPLTQGYNGAGVVIGFIDTEVDYSHPDFKKLNGESRILYIWDHTITNGAKIPQPYNYGQEWTNADINANVPTSHIASTRAYLGHGTHVAGVAAGNGLISNNYKGIAPDASIIIVALNFNLSTDEWLTSIADAANYIYSKADTLGLPCVINASIGTYYGSHDGKDLQAQLIDNLVAEKKGRAFVCAAGNAGNIPFHLSYNVSADTSFTWFDPTTDTISFEVWSDTGQFENISFGFGADKVTPDYQSKGKTKFDKISNRLDTLIIDTLINDTNRIGIIKTFGELTEGRYVLNVDIVPDSLQFFWRFNTTGNGKFDIWSFNLVSNPIPDTSQFPEIAKYKLPDYNKTVTSSFACGKNVITVGNYVNRNSFMDFNGTLQTFTLTKGNIVENSSRGPTRDDRFKPDITATGDYTLSCIAMTKRTSIIANNPQTVAPGGYHVRMEGTSVSSPVVTGIAALYFQKYPDSGYVEVRRALINAAVQDNFTGFNLPDNLWGYGKVDAFGSLILPAKYGCTYQDAINYDSLATIDDGSCIFSGIFQKLSSNSDKTQMIIYPNPLHHQTIISYHIPVQRGYKTAHLKIYDILGNINHSVALHNNNDSIILNRNILKSGIYFCCLIIDGTTVSSQKLVVY